MGAALITLPTKQAKILKLTLAAIADGSFDYKILEPAEPGGEGILMFWGELVAHHFDGWANSSGSFGGFVNVDDVMVELAGTPEDDKLGALFQTLLAP